MSYPDIPYNPFYFLQGDTEIYNTLLDAKKGNHPLLKYFKILYPDKINQQPINAIYIGRLDSIHQQRFDTNETEEWEVNVEILITTKKYQKLNRRQLLKTAVYAIKEVISNSLVSGAIDFREVSFVYDRNNLIQFARMVIVMRETNLYNYESEMRKVCKILTEIDVEKSKTKE